MHSSCFEYVMPRWSEFNPWYKYMCILRNCAFFFFNFNVGTYPTVCVYCLFFMATPWRVPECLTVFTLCQAILLCSHRCREPVIHRNQGLGKPSSLARVIAAQVICAQCASHDAPGSLRARPVCLWLERSTLGIDCLQLPSHAVTTDLPHQEL